MTNVYLSDFHGCAYAMVRDLDSDGDYLIYTPLYTDGTYEQDRDEWCEVDHMALLGEEQDHQLHVEWVMDHLRVLDEGIFADPARVA